MVVCVGPLVVVSIVLFPCLIHLFSVSNAATTQYIDIIGMAHWILCIPPIMITSIL